MDSPTVKRAAVALLVALTLAALAWSIKTIVEAALIVYSMLSNIGDSSLWMLVISVVIVAALASVGYLFFDKLRNAAEEDDKEDYEDEEEGSAGR